MLYGVDMDLVTTDTYAQLGSELIAVDPRIVAGVAEAMRVQTGENPFPYSAGKWHLIGLRHPGQVARTLSQGHVHQVFTLVENMAGLQTPVVLQTSECAHKGAFTNATVANDGPHLPSLPSPVK